MVKGRPEVLEEIARVTQGKLLGARELESVVRSIAALPEPPPEVHRLPLWSHPAVASGVVLLMCVFWIGRKVVGLI